MSDEAKTALDVLREARELIADPEGWTQGTYARDGDGEPVHEDDPSACCWCASGALLRVTNGGFGGEYYDAVGTLNGCAREISQGTSRGFIMLNDDTDHATTLKAFDCAIKKAEAVAA